MEKARGSKRALLLSALSLLLCVSMLIGSTFAWFTDSVTSGKNQIVAGKLDVELEYKKVVNDVLTADWATVKDETDIFNPDALWEPGRVEVVYLKVSNLGSLALKYQLGVNFKDTAIGKTEDGKDIKLSEHLVFKTVILTDESEVGKFANRDLAKTEAGTEKGLTDYNGKTTELAPKSDDPAVNDEDYVALIIYMPETVGNEANYRGTDIPRIELGIKLFATQYTAEEDSFDEFYDKDAWADGMKVYNADDLGAALAKGGKVVLEADIVANEHMDIPEGVTVALNMNGHTLTGTAQNVIYSEGNLTIVGEGKINATKQGYNYAIRAQKGSIVIDGNIIVEGTFGCIEIYNGSNVTINKGSYNAVGINGMTSHTVYVAGSTLTVNGGTFDSGYSTEGIDTICGNSTATITLNGGRFYASELGESFFLKGNVVVNGGTYQYNPGSHVADGYKAVKNADGTYTVLKGDVVASSNAELSAAINAADNGDTVVLPAGTYTLPALTGKEGITIVGVEGTKINAVNSFGFGTDTVVKNVTFSGNEAVRYGYTHGDVVFENCTFDGKNFGFHVDSANDGTITFNDCTFVGFNAFASTGTYYFNECDFQYGTRGHTNMWGTGYFVDCTWGDKTSVGRGGDYPGSGKVVIDGEDIGYQRDFIGSATSLRTMRTNLDKNGCKKDQSYVLIADIDLTGTFWYPVNGTFAGTFDGQGHTIYGMDLAHEYVKSMSNVGFFTKISPTAVIKNVTFDNAKVYGEHYVGVIVGWEGNENANATIDNCHVVNSTVICNTDANNDNGDKVGGICGYAVSLNITNCSVKDTTIKAYRDFGGILGCSNGSKVNVTGNTVENVTLEIDNDVNYNNYTTEAEHNTNAIVGRVNAGNIANNIVK